MNIGFVRLFVMTGYWTSVNAIFQSCVSEIDVRGKTITSKSIGEETGVSDKIKCAVVCMKDLRCLTFVYSSSQKKCLMYSMSVDHYKNHLTEDIDGDSILARTCRIDTGRACKNKDECNFKGAICYAGACLCDFGHYFDPKKGLCLLKECENNGWGDEMDIYPEAGIRLHNDVGVYNVTWDECYEMCVQEKNFTCLTLEWSKDEDVFSHCLLSRNDFLDVADYDRKLECRGWMFAQRRCA